MNFKVGDKVVVTAPNRYYYTDVGSYGTVVGTSLGKVEVKIDVFTGKDVTSGMRDQSWPLEIKDLSHLTKLHKYLYGIE